MNIKHEEDFLKHLLKIDPKDVNIKFIFDHIRNYGICGAMLYVSVKVLANPNKTDVGTVMLDMLAGAVLFALPWFLFALNFVHGIAAFFSLRESKEVNKYLYLFFCFLLGLAAIKLMLFAKGI